MIAQHNKTLKWGISTLGCPEKSLDDVLNFAEKHHIEAIELRCLNNSLDLAEQLKLYSYRNMENIIRTPVKISALNSSFKLTDFSDDDLEELLSLAFLADAFKCKYIRVFHGKNWGDVCNQREYARAASALSQWQHWKNKNRVKVDLALEMHSWASSSQNCLEFFRKTGFTLPVIWDSHHTYVYAEEQPETTWKLMKEHIIHVHVKDSIMKPSARHPYTYVIPGKGTIPVARVLETLSHANYEGVVSLEWEKKWHPYLPEIDDAITELKTCGWRT